MPGFYSNCDIDDSHILFRGRTAGFETVICYTKLSHNKSEPLSWNCKKHNCLKDFTNQADYLSKFIRRSKLQIKEFLVASIRGCTSIEF